MCCHVNGISGFYFYFILYLPMTDEPTQSLFFDYLSLGGSGAKVCIT